MTLNYDETCSRPSANIRKLKLIPINHFTRLKLKQKEINKYKFGKITKNM